MKDPFYRVFPNSSEGGEQPLHEAYRPVNFILSVGIVPLILTFSPQGEGILPLPLGRGLR